MSAARLSERDKAEILKAYKAGEPIKDIASRFRVDQSYPTLLARRRGVTLRERHVRRS